MKSDLTTSIEDFDEKKALSSRNIDSLKKVTYASREAARFVKYFSGDIKPGAYATKRML